MLRVRCGSVALKGIQYGIMHRTVLEYKPKHKYVVGLARTV